MSWFQRKDYDEFEAAEVWRLAQGSEETEKNHSIWFFLISHYTFIGLDIWERLR